MQSTSKALESYRTCTVAPSFSRKVLSLPSRTNREIFRSLSLSGGIIVSKAPSIRLKKIERGPFFRSATVSPSHISVWMRNNQRKREYVRLSQKEMLSRWIAETGYFFRHKQSINWFSIRYHCIPQRPYNSWAINIFPSSRRNSVAFATVKMLRGASIELQGSLCRPRTVVAKNPLIYGAKLIIDFPAKQTLWLVLIYATEMNTVEDERWLDHFCCSSAKCPVCWRSDNFMAF